MSLRRAPSLGAVVLLILLVVVLVTGSDGDGDGAPDPPAQTALDGNPQPSAGDPVVPVLDVVDGDTIHVRLDGEYESVRYIGIDTPEVDPNIGVECFGKDASEENRRLVEGREVKLVFDAEERDRYGRLLAYIYRQPDDLFVNAAMVEGGFARTLTIEPNDSFADLLDRLEQAAANAGLGLWGEC